MKRIALLITALTACHHHSHDLAEDACAHMADAPQSIDAATDASAAPSLDMTHVRYDINLVETADERGGLVSFAATEAGEYYFFLGAEVPMSMSDPIGASVPFTQGPEAVEECEELASHYVIELGVGSYLISFGPTSVELLSLIVIEADGEHHHH